MHTFSKTTKAYRITFINQNPRQQNCEEKKGDITKNRIRSEKAENAKNQKCYREPELKDEQLRK